MAQADRRAEAVWVGNLTEGRGTITETGSGALGSLPVTWAARTESSDGKTSPEELLAAAHASCYAMAFANVLNKAGHPPEQLRVTAVTTFVPGKGVTTSNLEVWGRVPGLDQAAFERVAHEGEQNCPISNALRNNVEIGLQAHLES